MTRPDEAALSRPATAALRPKQLMLYADQQTDLDALARALHDARQVRGERITANTLIRIAIDGLVVHGDRLQGDNEKQLLESWLAYLDERSAAGR
jgi:hypothetical protein